MKKISFIMVATIVLFCFLSKNFDVYGQGFSTTATNWTLPSGGQLLSGHNYGYNNIANTVTYDNGNQGWTTMDISGDGNVDLVVLAQGNGTTGDCFGVGSSPYWKVYLNTGSGFSTTATNWTLPSGGQLLSGHNYGYNNIANTVTYANGNQGWTTMDINGDGNVDLVVLAQGNGTTGDCFGVGSSPYWKVYLNMITSVVQQFENDKINITIYPNPSNGKFQFTIDGSQFAKNFKVEIYNVQGEIIYQSAITNTKSDIDLSNTTNGIYFAIFFNEQTILTKKIVIE